MSEDVHVTCIESKPEVPEVASERVGGAAEGGGDDEGCEVTMQDFQGGGSDTTGSRRGDSDGSNDEGERHRVRLNDARAVFEEMSAEAEATLELPPSTLHALLLCLAPMRALLIANKATLRVLDDK